MFSGAEYGADESRARALDFLLGLDARTLPEAAVRFAISHPDVSTAIVGFSSTEQLEAAVDAVGRGLLPGAVSERLKRLWASDFGLTS